MSEVTITRIEELENVKTAYFLEGTISKLEKEIQTHLEHKPRKPKKPVLKTENVPITPYPTIDTSQIKRPETWKKGLKISAIGVIVSIAGNLLPFLFVISLLGGLMTMGGLVYSAYLFLTAGKEKKH